MQHSRVSPWSLGLACVIGANVIATSLSASPQTTGAQVLVEKARAALGGDTAFSSLKVAGSMKTGTRGGSGTFEITYALPSRFVQKEVWTYLDPGDSVEKLSPTEPSAQKIFVTLGFDGDDAIYSRNPSERAWSRSPVLYSPERSAPYTKAQIQSVLPKARTAFLNLTLGLFAASFPGAPVTFTDATGADAGRSVMVEGQGIKRTLVFDARSALPERLDGVRYLDYRDMAGRKVPSRLVDGSVEWIIERFTIVR